MSYTIWENLHKHISIVVWELKIIEGDWDSLKHKEQGRKYKIIIVNDVVVEFNRVKKYFLICFFVSASEKIVNLFRHTFSILSILPGAM